MANVIFNIAKGRLAQYADLPQANDALILVPFAASGLGSDATLVDCATLTAVKAAATEQTTLGRKTLSGVTVTVDNANDRVNIDAGDVTWTGTGGAAIGAVVICYDPDTTGGTDSDLIPLSKHDCAMTPDGTDFVLTINDFARAS